MTITSRHLETAVDRGSPASLVAHFPLVVLDISTRGCLIESRRPVETGQIATLRLALNGVWYVEDLRITRCVQVPGRGSTYHIGAEFLRTHAPREGSLRAVLSQLTSAALDEEPNAFRVGSEADRRP